MNDDDKALVKRLGAQKNNQLNAIEALARIEAQAAEIERLREALAATVDIWNRSKYSGDFEYWLTGHVRAALGETK